MINLFNIKDERYYFLLDIEKLIKNNITELKIKCSRKIDLFNLLIFFDHVLKLDKITDLYTSIRYNIDNKFSYYYLTMIKEDDHYKIIIEEYTDRKDYSFCINNEQDISSLSSLYVDLNRRRCYGKLI